MKKIVITPIECVGCASCVDIAPAYFGMDSSGKAFLHGGRTEKGVVVTELFAEDEAALATIVECCPSRCISVAKK